MRNNISARTYELILTAKLKKRSDGHTQQVAGCLVAGARSAGTGDGRVGSWRYANRRLIYVAWRILQAPVTSQTYTLRRFEHIHTSFVRNGLHGAGLVPWTECAISQNTSRVAA
jgi:hypothetical protein